MQPHFNNTPKSAFTKQVNNALAENYLSSIEIQLLEALCMGKYTAAEQSKYMRRSKYAVNDYRKALFAKLDCRSFLAVVDKSIDYGFIEVKKIKAH
jgi:DNA-binding NarL/FixJ family response regulator